MSADHRNTDSAGLERQNNALSTTRRYLPIQSPLLVNIISISGFTVRHIDTSINVYR